jgi:hypothetical protein
MRGSLEQVAALGSMPGLGLPATPRRSFAASAPSALHSGRASAYSPWAHVLSDHQEVRAPLGWEWDSLADGGEMKEPPKAFEHSPVKVVRARDLKTIFLVTSRRVQEGEVINIAAPYVKALGSFNRCKYCYHCHLRFDQPQQIKSAHTEDYFGFDTCRSIFDETRARAAPLHNFMVENVSVWASRFGDEAMYISTGAEKTRVSQSDLDMVNLALEVLIKRDAELRGEVNGFQKQVTWGKDRRCVEMPPQPPESASLVQAYQPTFNDFLYETTNFASIPESVIPHLSRIADIVARVLQETGTAADLNVSNDKMIEMLYCCLRYKKPIVRGQGRDARQTGLGLFPTAGYFLYADLPNCDFFFDENTNMVVRTKKALERNTLLTPDTIPMSLQQARSQQIPHWADWLADA